VKKALITGGLGQDGSFLSEYLLSLGYEVTATVRMNRPEVHSYYIKGVQYLYGDLTDLLSMEAAIRKCQPDELYNLAGQTFVPTSFEFPVETLDANVSGLARILRIVERSFPKTKVYQASTSEMFGNTMQGKMGVISLDENSQMHPVSPYAVSKLAAHNLVDVYRQRGLYVVSGILFNHESERRGPEMVTRKITRHVANWKAKRHQDALLLGSITSKRDWGYAPDYVIAMHSMLQQPEPSDFVVGTGEAHSVNDFLMTAIEESGINTDWALDRVRSGTKDLQRRPELLTLVADNSRAKAILRWEPKHSFRQLVRKMVDHDYELNKIQTDTRIPQ
jgi:GDPmannose 4,6-dehydratase